MRVINELERDALERRAPDERDPRRNAVSITPAGVRARQALDLALDAAHEQLLAPPSERQRRQLDRLVEQHFGTPTRRRH